MWVIEMVVCMGLMLAGHAFMDSGQGSHSHEQAAARQPAAAATAPDASAAGATTENAPPPEPGHRH